MDGNKRSIRFSGLFVLQIVFACMVLVLLRSPLQADDTFAHGGQTDPDNSTNSATALPDVQITVDEIVAAGLRNPVQVTHAGDGSNRLFVVEQQGWIMIVKNGAVLPTPFLDLKDESAHGSSEQGLLGLAFHPEYGTNGYLYVNYTRASDGATVVERYQVSGSNPDQANPNSAQEIITIAQPWSNHNGGQVLFEPNDGYLYVGMGDGGKGGDPLDSGQDINTLLGAMLRLDVDAGTPYAIPPDNPYVGKPGRDEIWSIGLRNPWRFSFDRDNGDLYIGDVGQGEWEEIDYQAAPTPGGLNFGWVCKEGSHNFRFTGDCASKQLVDPIAEYPHTEGRSVTGGFVYRGVAYPALIGRYFYADYIEGKIWSVYKTGSNPDTWSAPELELDTDLNISSFGEDENGEVYVVDRSGGTIRRLADADQAIPIPSLSRMRVSTPSADPGETITYTIELINTGRLADQAIYLTDTIPAGLSYVPNSLQATHGTWDDQDAPTLTWQGNLNASREMTVTYQVQATGSVTRSIVNEASLVTADHPPITLAASVFVPRSVLTTTEEDFFIPGTQPENLNDDLVSSIDCDHCHSDPIYARWRGSMMSQAGRDPLLWAALSTANVDAPNSGDYCLRCHTPRGWLQGRSHPSDGSELLPDDIRDGVTCAFCHRFVDPFPSVSDEAVVLDQAVRDNLTDPIPDGYVGSAAIIVDPDDNRRGPFSFSPPLIYHLAYQTDFFDQHSDAITRARVCGSCHNVDNPALSWDEARNQFWPNPTDTPAPEFHPDRLFPIERTFSEWLLSEYATQGVYDPAFAGSKPDGIVSACQDCHQPSTTGVATETSFDPVNRDCVANGCLPEHIMVGGNTWIPQLLQDPDWRLSAEDESDYLNDAQSSAEQMLYKSASITITLTSNGANKIATVRVVNHTGHKLPTGYPEGRQMWLNLRAFDASGTLIRESGAYNHNTGQLTRDADAKIYECKQGITPELAAVLNKEAGSSFHFVLNNTTIKDNRIPPRGYTQATFDRPGLRPVGAAYADGQYWDDTIYTLPLETAKVIATLYYQTSSREYIEFLESHGGVDGLALAQLWDSLKSPPQLVATASIPQSTVYLPVIVKGQ